MKVSVFTEDRLEKTIRVFGEELSKLYEVLYVIQELVEQSNSNFVIYKKHINFFYMTYFSFYDQAIHSFSRLFDKSRGSLSIFKELEENIKHYSDDISSREKLIFEKLREHNVHSKLKTLRDKLGKAHIDEKVALNFEKQIKLYESNKTTLKELFEYASLLGNAIDIISGRLTNPILYLKPFPSIQSDIRKLFNDLKSTDLVNTL